MQAYPHISRKLKTLFAKSLLYAYLLSLFVLVFESSHVHESSVFKCKSVDHFAKADPCHLRLEHHDLLNGCKHSEHISNASHHCLLCDILLHFEYAVVSNILYLSIKNYHAINPYGLSDFHIIFHTALNNKAPPMLSC